ncbi:VOC family protein [Jeotgalibacillus soli]|uniref:PhnB-like domain-containing protein n=1 Tax=Jeotgalibacillus soli TaxID=889306 RepID=A0A0C2W5X2_9BACL|nr:hypothetical protein KP78_03460 [Jeotgalibacillus soli]
MKHQVTPYLTFDGNAREAMAFYAKVFESEMEGIQTFGDAEYPTPPEMDDRIMHGRLKKDDLLIMFSDSFVSQSVTVGNHISLALELESEEEINRIYDALRQEGKVFMELQDTFWGAIYAKMQDRFGVMWDLNYTKSSS